MFTCNWALPFLQCRRTKMWHKSTDSTLLHNHVNVLFCMNNQRSMSQAYATARWKSRTMLGVAGGLRHQSAASDGKLKLPTYMHRFKTTHSAKAKIFGKVMLKLEPTTRVTTPISAAEHTHKKRKPQPQASSEHLQISCNINPMLPD